MATEDMDVRADAEAACSLPRRRFMHTVALAAAAVTLDLPGRRVRAASNGQRVAIIGGGVAGLTAAQELAERGFQVNVYEQRAWGGKARSIPVPNTGLQGRLDLPGEHGFRFFCGFYQNLPDTLKRIPFANAAGNVWGNTVQPKQTQLADGSSDLYANNATAIPFPSNIGDLPTAISECFSDALFALGVPANDVAFFVSKLNVFMTSCDARRLQQWENMSWWDFVGAQSRSVAYQKTVGAAPLLFSAVRGKQASARTVAAVFEAIVYTYGRQGYAYPLINVLNRPTNEVWIDAWCSYLSGLGVVLNLGVQATQVQYANGVVSGIQATANGVSQLIEADWYVLAVPPEKVNALIPSTMQAVDSQFAGIAQLSAQWMTGVQFFLTQRAQINTGHVACLNSPWAVTCISQVQFWSVNFPATYGDGSVQDVLSVDVSDWTTPGVLYGLPANQCTPAQVAAEVLAQLRNDLPNGGRILPDSVIHSWVIDPGVSGIGTPTPVNADPLFINTAGSWYLRPDTATKIPNFFLAGDYVHATGFDLACMETANESGRRAANAILKASGSSTTPAIVHTRYASPLLAPQFTADAALFAACLPNTFDVVQPYFPTCSPLAV